jgi:outer membrane protein TolC
MEMRNHVVKQSLNLGLLLLVTLGLSIADCLAQAASASRVDGARTITLDEAVDRALNAAQPNPAANLAQLSVEVAKEHRKGVQADYFPKIGSTFTNLHFNKFLGDQIQLARRSVALPLLNKDQTLVAFTMTQPLTPLFKVQQVVKIARADERIAMAKAGMAVAELRANVEQAYYRLLISQRQEISAEATVRTLESQLQLVSTSPPPLTQLAERQQALLAATKTLYTVKSEVLEFTQSLNALIGLPRETELLLTTPRISLTDEPAISLIDATAQAMITNPAVIEAEQTVVKARAATKLSKLDYIPDVAVIGGYSYQTALPLLPNDFSFVGVMASYNVFDFGKREHTAKERKSQLEMAEAGLAMVKAQVGAAVQKSYFEVARTRRILQLVRQFTVSNQSAPAGYEPESRDASASQAKAEAELFQAELDYRLAWIGLKRAIGAQ